MVEDVVIPLLVGLVDYPGLLEQVGPHGGADDVVGVVEADFDVFAEARGIVVSRRLRISDRLHDRVRSQHFLLDLRLWEESK